MFHFPGHCFKILVHFTFGVCYHSEYLKKDFSQCGLGPGDLDVNLLLDTCTDQEGRLACARKNPVI